VTRRGRALLLAGALLLGTACDRAREERSSVPLRASLVAAGDVASCWWRADEATARVLDRVDGTIAALGDLVYQSGTEAQFRDCYGPTWGRHRERTRPVIGNHDRRTEKGGPYFRYFGARAGRPGEGWYSYHLDGWHVIALNSEVPMTPGSAQLLWLAADLRANPRRCTLAYMHRPRFSSGKHGGSERVRYAWKVLYENGVDVVLAGHDHLYERFAPLTPDGELDPQRGIVSFVIGTGGSPLYALSPRMRQTVVRQNRVHGVVAFHFRPDGYRWEFIAANGTFNDRGSRNCH